MAYSDEVRHGVRRAFVGGLSLKDACAQHDVPYETGRTWKRKAAASGDCWDNARAATRISASGTQALTNEVIEDFVHLFKSTIEILKNDERIQPLQRAEALARLSDAYQKTIKAAGDSNPKLSKLAVAMDVLQRQAQYIREHHPDLVQAFIVVLEPFGEELSRAYR